MAALSGAARSRRACRLCLGKAPSQVVSPVRLKGEAGDDFNAVKLGFGCSDATEDVASTARSSPALAYQVGPSAP